MYCVPGIIGDLLRTGMAGNTTFTSGGAGGRIQKIEWDGTVAREYEYSSDYYSPEDRSWSTFFWVKIFRSAGRSRNGVTSFLTIFQSADSTTR